MLLTRTSLCITASLCLLLSGCSWFGDHRQPSLEDQLSKDQILRIVETNSVPTLDSTLSSDSSSGNVLNNLQEGLMRQGKDKKLEHALAQDVDISLDKTKYTFHLREGVVWSDGKKLTAQNFEYAWKRLADPKMGANYSYMMALVQQVRAKDELTLEVKLHKPVLNFLSLTTLASFYPLRQDIVEKYHAQYATAPDKMVYCGPFKLIRWTQSQLELQKNDQYYDQNAVTLKKVEIHVVKDPTTALQLYNAGKVDIAPLNQAFVDVYKQTRDYVYVDLASTVYLLMNQKNPFFQNPNIRKAFSLALDRQDLTNQFLKDGSKPAGSLIPPSINGPGTKSFRANGEVVHPDAKEARRLFQLGMNELKLSKPPSNITMVTYDTPPRRDLSVAIQERLKNVLGIQIKLHAQPLKNQLKKAQAQDFDMMMLGWGADYNDPLTFLEIFRTKNPMNYSGYSNSRYDDLIQQGSQEVDQQKQLQNYLQAEKILVGTDAASDAALIPLYYVSKAFVQRTHVKDFYRHAYGAEYSLKWAYKTK